MRRSFRLFTLTSMLAVCAFSAQAQTHPSVDEIVAKNLAAKGGVDTLKSIQTSRLTCTTTLQGTPAEMTILAKRPNLARQEVTVHGQKIVIMYDGTHAWMLNPALGPDPVQLPEAAAANVRAQAQFDSPLLGYRSGDTKVEFAGVETIDGRKAYHLLVTPHDSTTRGYYIDADTGLEVRVDTTAEQNGRSGTLSFHMSDYRDVDGVKLPFSLSQSFDGEPVATISVEKIELNVPLDDSLFKPGA